MVFSESECREIIATKLNTENFIIDHHQETSFDTVNGFLGDHSTLSITITRDNVQEKHIFFVKSLPTIQSQRTYALEVNGFFKEHFFFTQFQSLLKEESINLLHDSIPTCYFTDGERFVFDDLTLKNYVTMQSRVALDVPYVKKALESLASLHASAIILEEKKKITLTERFPEEFAESWFADKESTKAAMKSYKHGFEGFLDLNVKDPTTRESLKRKIFEGCDLQKVFVEPSTQFRNTLCHGDLWTKNIMFKVMDGKPQDCIIIDFQSYRYGPPAQDVVAFLYLTTGRAFREEHLEEMLEFYYEEFDKKLRKFDVGGVVSREEFFESCHFYKRFALTQAGTHFQVVVMSDELANELLGDPEKAKYVLFDNKYDFVMAACERDVIYKKMNLEIMEELRDFYQL